MICKSEKSDVSLSRVEVTRHVLVRYNLNTVLSFIGGNMGLWLGVGTLQVVLQKVASELHPKVRNHGEGPY